MPVTTLVVPRGKRVFLTYAHQPVISGLDAPEGQVRLAPNLALDAP